LASSVTLTLPNTYGYVILAGALLALELLLVGFCCAFRARFKYFNGDFMEKYFGEIHKDEIGQDVAMSGYPDMGSGRYSDKLTYRQWFEFNNYQRVHQNFLEFAPIIFLTLFLAGIYYPLWAAILGLILVVARLVYTIGYIAGGPNFRIFGALFNHLSVFALIGLSFASGCQFLHGNTP
jgi:uncharacterized membrane protein YecN with MAPEG domain